MILIIVLSLKRGILESTLRKVDTLSVVVVVVVTVLIIMIIINIIASSSTLSAKATRNCLLHGHIEELCTCVHGTSCALCSKYMVRNEMSCVFI